MGRSVRWSAPAGDGRPRARAGAGPEGRGPGRPAPGTLVGSSGAREVVAIPWQATTVGSVVIDLVSCGIVGARLAPRVKGAYWDPAAPGARVDGIELSRTRGVVTDPLVVTGQAAVSVGNLFDPEGNQPSVTLVLHADPGGLFRFEVPMEASSGPPPRREGHGRPIGEGRGLWIETSDAEGAVGWELLGGDDQPGPLLVPFRWDLELHDVGTTQLHVAVEVKGFVDAWGADEAKTVTASSEAHVVEVRPPFRARPQTAPALVEHGRRGRASLVLENLSSVRPLRYRRCAIGFTTGDEGEIPANRALGRPSEATVVEAWQQHDDAHRTAIEPDAIGFGPWTAEVEIDRAGRRGSWYWRGTVAHPIGVDCVGPLPADAIPPPADGQDRGGSSAGGPAGGRPPTEGPDRPVSGPRPADGNWTRPVPPVGCELAEVPEDPPVRRFVPTPGGPPPDAGAQPPDAGADGPPDRNLFDEWPAPDGGAARNPVPDAGAVGPPDAGAGPVPDEGEIWGAKHDGAPWEGGSGAPEGDGAGAGEGAADEVPDESDERDESDDGDEVGQATGTGLDRRVLVAGALGALVLVVVLAALVFARTRGDGGEGDEVAGDEAASEAEVAEDDVEADQGPDAPGDPDAGADPSGPTPGAGTAAPAVPTTAAPVVLPDQGVQIGPDGAGRSISGTRRCLGPGQARFTLQGSGFDPGGELVQVSVGGSGASGPIGPDGSFSVVVEAPLPGGSHPLSASDALGASLGGEVPGC